MKLEMRKCEACGQLYKPTRSKQRFCSPYCRDRIWHETNRKKYKLICIVCHKEFEDYNRLKKCCSPECAMESRKRLRAEKQAVKPRRRKKGVDYLAIDAKEAKEHGMSYGQWMAYKMQHGL